MKKLKYIIVRMILREEIEDLLDLRCDYETALKKKKILFDYYLGKKSGIEQSLYFLTGLNY